jgi:hypothetical protein
MTSPWEDLESEAYDDSEGDYDSEADYDSEDTRADAARRARARRITLARRRMVQSRLRPSPPTPMVRAPTPRQTVAAIRNLDLETKVGEDSLRRALDQSNRRAARATWATVASVAVDQGLDSFGSTLAGHQFVRAGLRFAPLLLLSPQKRAGFEGWILDPRVIGGAAVAGVVAAGVFHNRGSRVDNIEIAAPTLVEGDTGRLRAVTVDRNGNVIDNIIVWKSQDDAILSVAPTGEFEAKSDGTALVTATGGGFTKAIFLIVNEDSSVD